MRTPKRRKTSWGCYEFIEHNCLTVKWSYKNADFAKFPEQRLNWKKRRKARVLERINICFTSNKIRWLFSERLKNLLEKERVLFLYLSQA